MNYKANTLWMLSERVSRLIFVFFINVLIARYLGPDDFGILNYAISLVGLLVPVSMLGFDVVLVKELVVHKRLNGILLYTAFSMMFVVSVVVVLFIWIFAGIFEKNNIAIIIQVYSLTLLLNPAYVIDYFYQAKVMAKYSAIAYFLQSIFSISFKLYLLSIDADLYWFAIAFFMDSVWLLIFLGCVFFIRKDIAGKKIGFNKTVAYVLLRRSLPLVFSGLMVIVYMRIDQVMLMWMVGESAVGAYAVAVRLSEAWYFVPIAITASLFPMILNHKNTQEKYLKSIQRLMDFLVYMSVSIAFIFLLFGAQIIHFIYGSEYEASVAIIAVHAWTGVFVSLGLVSGKWLVAENLHSYTFYRTLSGAVINILLNYILIVKFGVLGAAVATLVAQIFAAFIFDVFFTKTREMFVMKLTTLLFLSIIRDVVAYVKKYTW